MRKTTIGAFCFVVVFAWAAKGNAQSNVDPAHKFAWQENCGWLNWRHDAPMPGDGVRVTDTYLAGFVWAENVGWINLGNGSPPDGVHYLNDPTDSSTFGVNIDPDTGNLFGLAWGENVGWISFDTQAALEPYQQQARLDVCENTLFGYAWGENIGWINLDDAAHFIALGPTCAPGDVACDGVITLSDYTTFGEVFMGPDIPVDCPTFDSDGDADVDLRDFAILQAGFTD